MEWFEYAVAIVVGATVIFALTPAVEWALGKIDPDGTGVLPGTLRGGRWIGRLERAWAYVAVAIGATSTLPVLIAIKGLGRFGDLKDAGTAFAERFIIGSLLSLGSACAAGLLVKWLMTELS